MRNWVGRFAALGLVACTATPPDLHRTAPATFHLEPGGHEIGRVVGVADGDTIEVVVTGRVEGPGAGLARPGHRYEVRFIGIDTPESVDPDSPVECYGREASSAAKALLAEKTVRLVDDVEQIDAYDRLLRYVYVGDEMANARLVLNGYASAYTHPPNVRHTDLFVSLQREARSTEAGLWSESACPGPPDGPG